MRPIDPSVLKSLAGSRPEDKLTAQVWRGDQDLVADLDLSGWSLNWDQSRIIKAQGSVTVNDPTGQLAPWLPEDTLGTGGSRLALAVIIDGYRLDIGEMTIVQNQPKERWRMMHDLSELVSGGAEIPLTLADLTDGPNADDFFAPESPPAGQRAKAELQRILADHFAVEIDPVIDDLELAAGYVHDENRLNAADDLLTLLGGRARMTSTGTMYVYPVRTPAEITAADAVWDIAPGADGTLVDFTRSQTKDGLYNAWVVEGETSGDRAPIRVPDYDTGGALAWGGPLGRRPQILKNQANIKTNDDALRMLRKLRAEATRGRVQALSVTCLSNPALELGDVVNLPIPPLRDPLPCLVETISLSSRSTMTLGVSTDFDRLRIMLGKARR